MKKSNVSKASILALAFSAILGLSMTGCASKNIDASNELKTHVEGSIVLPDEFYEEDVTVTNVVADKMDFSKGATINLFGEVYEYEAKQVKILANMFYNYSDVEKQEMLNKLKDMPNLGKVTIVFDCSNLGEKDIANTSSDVYIISKVVNNLELPGGIEVFLSHGTQEVFDAICDNLHDTRNIVIYDSTSAAAYMKMENLDGAKHTTADIDAANHFDISNIQHLKELEFISIDDDIKLDNFEALGSCKQLKGVSMAMHPVNTNSYFDNVKLYDLSCFSGRENLPALYIRDIEKDELSGTVVDEKIDTSNHYVLKRFGFYNVNDYYNRDNLVTVIY